MTTLTHDNTAATDAFVQHKTRIDDLLAQMTADSAVNFGLSPDTVTQGQALLLRDAAEKLALACEWLGRWSKKP